jgi:hypothetical protein
VLKVNDAVGALTDIEDEAECVTPLEMPLTLNLYVEAASEAGVVNVRTEAPLPATVGGRNHPFAPVGRLVPLNVTVPVNP